MTDSTATTILSRQIGSTVLAAATTDQEALEGYQDHGLFTRVIADGLGGQAASNGIVSNFSLADYVGAEVPPLASNIYRHDQTPTISANGQRFPIAAIKISAKRFAITAARGVTIALRCRAGFVVGSICHAALPSVRHCCLVPSIELRSDTARFSHHVFAIDGDAGMGF